MPEYVAALGVDARTEVMTVPRRIDAAFQRRTAVV